MLAELGNSPTYRIRRANINPLLRTWSITNWAGKGVAVAEMRALALRTRIIVYTDRARQAERLRIASRQHISFSPIYDVVDSLTRQRIGAFQRHRLTSLIRDRWTIMDGHDRKIGVITEDSLQRAVDRRFFDSPLPQHFFGEIGGARVCVFEQQRSLFWGRITLDLRFEGDATMDRRVGLAAALLLCAVEGRQRRLVSAFDLDS